MSYLKALGVFRALSSQKDPGARSWWQSDVFHVRSTVPGNAVAEFFLTEYQPAPIVAPWNGGSGFYPKDNRKAINEILASSSDRLATYRNTIQSAQRILGSSVTDKPTKEAKPDLLRRLRSGLPDAALDWIDGAAVDTIDRLVFAPVLGTGGNDGRLDFSQNYMQRVVEVLLPRDRNLARRRLERALHATGSVPLVEAAIGQFDPGGIGGPNALPGFKAGSLVNPWDFVFMLEGTLVLAGSASRRLAGSRPLRGTFPFTVDASAAGWGTIGPRDVRAARAEIWLPLWPNPSTFSEVQHLFAEGRAEIGRKAARTGVDFARAIAGLGIDRGIEGFQRFGFLKRSGKNFLAAPIGRFTVHGRDEVRLINELDGWLNSLRHAATAKDYPARYQAAFRVIDEAIFDYCEFGGRRRLQTVLAAVGATERDLAVGGTIQKKIRPIQGLSPAWLSACDDGTPELRIAAALASIYGGAGPIRHNLEPVVLKRRWEWSSSKLGVAWGHGDLSRNLAAVLSRRQIETARGEQGDGRGIEPNAYLRSRLAVSLSDVHRFLTGGVDEDRVADLLWALGGLNWSETSRRDGPKGQSEPVPELPRAYDLLKLLHLTVPIVGPKGEAVAVEADPAAVERLRAGDLNGAVTITYRRLRAKGLVPLGGSGPQSREAPDLVCTPVVRSRLAASLLIPIYQTDTLVRRVLRPPDVPTIPIV